MPDDINLDFTPVPSLRKLFYATPDIRMVFVFGPVGSTKTTTCLFWLMMRAASQAPSPDGVRRTRFGIVRNTLVNLKQTVVKDILSLFAGLAHWRPSDNTFFIRHADIESEWMLLGLDKPEDVRRLLSLQLTGVYVNEVRELDYPLIFAAYSRTGRFPSPRHGHVACTYRFLIADSNMGVEGSKLHEFLEQKKHPAVMFIHQPGALTTPAEPDKRWPTNPDPNEKPVSAPYADWLQYLPEGYYPDLMIGATRAWIDTHVHANWSDDLSGEPIFASVFNEHFHVARSPIQVLPGYPIVCGIDPGINPACIFGQMTHNGQLRVLREVFAPNVLMTTFMDNYLLPQMQMPGFSGKLHRFVMDPAGKQRNPMIDLTPKGFMESKGFDITLAPTNDVGPRIKAIELYLTEIRGLDNNTTYLSLAELRQQGPTPAILIDPSCTTLIAALKGKYRYKRKKVTLELEDTPEKKHPISDVVDALGYLCMGISGMKPFRRKATNSVANRTVQTAQVDPRAYT